MRQPRAISILILFAASLLSQPGLAANKKGKITFSAGEHACTTSENWLYGDSIAPQWRDEMDRSIAKRTTPVYGFSNALAMRKFSESEEGKLLAEYWISRSLYEAKLNHIAYSGFSHIAARPVTIDNIGIQISAVDCINQIQRKYHTLPLPSGVTALIGEYLNKSWNEKHRQIVWEYVGNMVRVQLASNETKAEVLKTLTLLKGSGAHEALARGLWAARHSDHMGAISEFERFLANPTTPKFMRTYFDEVHVQAARAYFSTGNHDKAVQHLKLVSKTSNQLSTALTEMSWNFLMAEKYPEAIGTALNLQKGGLSHTYSPESHMVMAMALNEICQYPESLSAVYKFRRLYEPSYRWLNAWLKRDTKNANDPQANLYKMAIQFLRKKGDLPDKIGSEWMRTPVFISHQDEINALFDERDNTIALAKAGAKEQKKLGSDILRFASELKKKTQIAKASQRPGDNLPKSLQNDLEKLRTMVNSYRRFRAAAPVWRVILANFQKTVSPREKGLVAAINEDLARRNKEMYAHLEEIAENNQLVEVEIYNGASQDIIWQNAHPDYKEVAQKIKDEQKVGGAAQSWDWGRTPANSEEAGEIWEDELGSSKASLFDNCNSKDKYLALKRNF